MDSDVFKTFSGHADEDDYKGVHSNGHSNGNHSTTAAALLPTPAVPAAPSVPAVPADKGGGACSCCLLTAVVGCVLLGFLAGLLCGVMANRWAQLSARNIIQLQKIYKICRGVSFTLTDLSAKEEIEPKHCRTGYSGQLGTLVLSEDTGHQDGRVDTRGESRGESRPRCTLTLNTRQPSSRHLNCDTCFRARRDHTHYLQQIIITLHTVDC